MNLIEAKLDVIESF
jgi:hypothetical protein